MKNKQIIMIVGLLGLGTCAQALGQSGVYMNIEDYKNNRLTYTNDCKSAKHNRPVRVHDFFWGMKGVRVVHDGKKYTFKKQELFGYKDCNDQVYRFYNNTEYRIAEAGRIYIYVKEENVAQSKGFKVVNSYYFSTAPDHEIMPLTMANLKAAYGNDEKFVARLERTFDNSNLSRYDNVNKTFGLNDLFSKTNENSNK